MPYAEGLLQRLAEALDKGTSIDKLAREIVAAYREGEFKTFKRRKLPDYDRTVAIAARVQDLRETRPLPAAIDDVAEEFGYEDRSVVAKAHRKHEFLIQAVRTGLLDE